MHRAASIPLIVMILAGTSAWADDPSIDEIQRSEHCGAMCLYIALRSLDVEVADVQEVIDRLGSPPPGGYNLLQLKEAAEAYGMHTRGVETSADNLSRRPGRFACIAHYEDGHFVNLANVEEGQVHLIDAPRSLWVPIETFDSRWSHHALLISHDSILAEDELPLDLDWTRIAIIVGIGVLAAAIVFVALRRRRAPEAG